jgi:SNF2 family DNA or RNA helicase
MEPSAAKRDEPSTAKREVLSTAKREVLSTAKREVLSAAVSDEKTVVLAEFRLQRKPLKHQNAAVDFMVNAETRHGGSVLGDDMGLGKTTSVILLMIRRVAPVGCECKNSAVLLRVFSDISLCLGFWVTAPLAEGATLVVCPLVVLSQWEKEIRAVSSDMAALGINVYHGPNRKLSPSARVRLFGLALLISVCQLSQCVFL